ncbi:MAG: methyltransferase domain-containing protein, partial [Pseudobutyrivibrio sp.]|nr:methyltransferase domain-containing protein [Pseudobutyrivibrio sp.]
CYISDYDSIGSISEFNEGLFYVQDYSSQLVPYKACIKISDKVLDVCAAPGGKALHTGEIAKNGHVLARDLTDAKVALIQSNIDRTGAGNVTAEKWDATIFDEKSENQYDVVIADLPCSGLGIIRKKPDIKYNQSEASLQELESLQAQILDNASRYVKANGTLCYSTCTINKAENDIQVENFLRSHSQFRMIEQEQLFPDKNHDGFYICVMKKN